MLNIKILFCPYSLCTIVKLQTVEATTLQMEVDFLAELENTDNFQVENVNEDLKHYSVIALDLKHCTVIWQTLSFITVVACVFEGFELRC